MDELISVIVPVFNVEKYLNKCIDSIISQTYKKLEILLIDDGSTDKCSQICNEYARVDSRVKVIHQKNAGLSAARNVGLEIAKGDYIGFVDSDDYIAQNMYESLFKIIKKTNSDLAICNWINIDEYENNIYESSPIIDEILTQKQAFKKLEDEKWWYYVVAWNKLYRSSIFKEIRYPIGKINEDLAVIHEVFSRCGQVASTEKRLYYYVKREGSIMDSSTSIRRLDAVEALSKRYYFYKEKELNEFLPNTIKLMLNEYFHVRGKVRIKCSADRTRVHEIDKMLKEIYFLHFSPTRLIDKIRFLKPGVFAFAVEMKARMRIRTRVRIVNEIWRYFFHINSSKYILIDTPVHGNLGDHAIAMAEQQFLEKYGGRYQEVTSAEINNKEDIYAAITPVNKTILLHGGGFLGNLWPEEEYRFRRILKAFCKHKVIVFPQTITFDLNTSGGRRFFEESKNYYMSHPNLLICVREQKSYEFMQKYMPDVKIILVPDIVTLLDVSLKKTKRSGILMCMRKDTEKVLSEEDYRSIIAILQQKYPTSELMQTDTVTGYNIIPKNRKAEVEAKLQYFAKASLVVTDRLHGMLFATITNTPCIALGNCNGKIKGVYNWIKESDYVKYVDDPDQLEKVLQNLDINKNYYYRIQKLDAVFDSLKYCLINSTF